MLSWEDFSFFLVVITFLWGKKHSLLYTLVINIAVVTVLLGNYFNFHISFIVSSLPKGVGEVE